MLHVWDLERRKSSRNVVNDDERSGACRSSWERSLKRYFDIPVIFVYFTCVENWTIDLEHLGNLVRLSAPALSLLKGLNQCNRL